MIGTFQNSMSVGVCGGGFLCQISADTQPDAHPNVMEPRSPGGKISLPLTKPRLTA